MHFIKRTIIKKTCSPIRSYSGLQNKIETPCGSTCVVATTNRRRSHDPDNEIPGQISGDEMMLKIYIHAYNIK